TWRSRPNTCKSPASTRTAMANVWLSSRRPRGQHVGGAPCSDAAVARKGIGPYPVRADTGGPQVTVAGEQYAGAGGAAPRLHRGVLDPGQRLLQASSVTKQAVVPPDVFDRHIRGELLFYECGLGRDVERRPIGERR